MNVLTVMCNLFQIPTRLCLLMMCVLHAFFANAAIKIDSYEGEPTKNEINSFKAEILTLQPGTGGNLNPTNYWTQHAGGQRIRAMGLIYEMTHDQDILDRMIYFCDAVLSQRNDVAAPPTGQNIIWTGRVDPVWPNSSTMPIGTGGEQGDPIGHLAYCARLILQTPPLWNKAVRVGDPRGYGASYLARAQRFVREADYSLDNHVLSHLLNLSNQNRMYWGAGNPYQSGSVPWNQQVMFTYAFQNLARAHEILNDDTARVTLYDAIVRAFANWFFSGEAGTAQPYTNSRGNTSYLWSYRPPTGIEDWSHGNLDVMGLYRAYESGRYGITSAQMTPLANTLMDVIRRSDNSYAGRVNGTDGSGNSGPTTYVRSGWYFTLLFRQADFLTIVSDDLAVGVGTTDITRIANFLWVKHKRANASIAPVALYQGCNYSGWSAGLVSGSYTLSNMAAAGARNDDASSIRIASGYQVKLYQHNNYGGSSVTLTGDSACLTGVSFNDMASSLEISTFVPSSSSVASSSSSVVSSSSAASSTGGSCATVAQYSNGLSYNAGAVVKNAGNKYRCDVAGWCSQGGPYEPGVGWAWTYAWTLTSSCL